MCFIPFFKSGMGGGSLGSNRERGHWNPCFTRALNDWKVDKVEDLFLRLQGKTVDSVGEDTIVWMNLYNNKFFVKYLYVALEPRDLISKADSLEFMGLF